MVTVCPDCRTSIYFNASGRVDGITIRCSSCGSLFRIVKKTEQGAPRSPASSPSAARRRIVVASEQKEFCASVRAVLPEERFDLVYCHDGRIALQIISRLKPDGAVIDVALPGMFGFEVCESVRNDPRLGLVRLILVATVHDDRRYVRTPATLYGADALIEPHRLPGSLLQLVEDLVPVPEEPLPAPAEQEPPEPPVSAGAGPTGLPLHPPEHDEAQPPASPVPLPAEHVKAQRLARLIVSDIALYNKTLIEEGVRNGNLFDLLADDVREARALFERRVPEDVRNCTTYLDDAFSDLIARKKEELSRGGAAFN